MTCRRRRCAFTLIELLVVIAVIGVLVGLLVPAVQAAREAARRTQCVNNLKQIGIALNSYLGRRGVLPPGYVSDWDQSTGSDLGPGWSWASMILPELEQQALFDSINFQRQVQAPANSTARLVPLNVFLCPSDSMPPAWTATYGSVKTVLGRVIRQTYPICDVAGSNYVGVYGIGEPGVDGDGVFFRNSSIRAAQVSDGMDNTLCVGERSSQLDRGRGQATWTGSVTGAMYYTCGIAADPDASGPCVIEDASSSVLGHTGEGHGPGDPFGDVNQFLCRHGQGASFLFCDGHVKFLNRFMDYNTYKALSTRAGKEVITNDF